MKPLFIFFAFSVLLLSCGKDNDVIDVKSLIIGNWKLTQFKQDNQPWKDSTGTFYKFINDTLVNTEIFSQVCDRKYTLSDGSEGLKSMYFQTNASCYFSDWQSVQIISINSFEMIIMYPDYIGGGPLIKKYEKYLKN